MLPIKFQFIWLRGFRGEDRLWWPCLLMDRDGMSNLYRGPSIDASTMFWIAWPSSFRGEDF
jgi:hypothetical protein